MASGAHAQFVEDISYEASRMPQGELNGEDHINGTGLRQVSGGVDSFSVSKNMFFQFPLPVQFCAIYQIGLSVTPCRPLSLLAFILPFVIHQILVAGK